MDDQTVQADRYRTDENPLRIELGAGYRPTPGFIHNDARPGDDIEIVHPAERITDVVGWNTVDELRATHLLEHFPFPETLNVLRNWHQALCHGGLLYIEVPNFAWQTRAHAAGEITDEEAVVYVYGEQDYPENTHRAGFTPELLHHRLEEAGFVEVDVQDIGQVVIASARKECK